MYQKVSVLIIEDEKSICDFISKTLSSNEYKAVSYTHLTLPTI